MNDFENSKADSSNNHQATAVAVGALALFFLPIAVVHLLRFKLLTQAWAWRRITPSTGTLLATASCIGMVAAGGLVRSWLVAGCPTDLNVGLLIADCWVLLSPSAAVWLLFARWNVARQLSEGKLDPSHEARIRRAMLVSADQDAYRRCGWDVGFGEPHHDGHTQLPDTPLHGSNPVIGVVVDRDRRSPVARQLHPDPASPQHANTWLTECGHIQLPRGPVRACITGISGRGKSVAANAITFAHIKRGGRTLVIDAKGVLADAEALFGLAMKSGIDPERIAFWPRHPWALWRGNAQSVVSQAMALLPQDGPSYYRQQEFAALTAVAKAAPEPWRTTEELLDRLKQPQKYAVDSNDLAMLRGKVGNGQTLAERVRLAVATSTSGLHLSASGIALESPDWNLAIVSAPASDPTAARMIKAVLADFESFRSETQRQSSNLGDLLVVLDEAGAILDQPDSPDIALVAEQVRAMPGMGGIVVTSQSVAGLGDNAGRFLGSGATILTTAVTDPEEISKCAGTYSVPERAHQAQHGRPTGTTTARSQRAFKLPPDDIRNLGLWRFAIYEPAASGVVHAVIPPVNSSAEITTRTPSESLGQSSGNEITF